MRRPLRWLAGLVGVLIVLPVVALGAVVLLLNTDPGRRLAAREAGRLTGGAVTLEGLGGRFPDRLRLSRLGLRDGAGVYLTADEVALDWSPLALLRGQARIERLRASRLDLARLPQPAPGGPASSSASTTRLPVRVTLQRLEIGQAHLAAAVAGAEISLALAGAADLTALDSGRATLSASAADGGAYALEASLAPAAIEARLSVTEPAGGLVSRLAALPDLGAIGVKAAVSGPRSALSGTLDATAGLLTAAAKGRLDLDARTLAADVAAHAPAMSPGPDLGWERVSLDAHLSGPFTAPSARGTLRVAGLRAYGAGAEAIEADLAGDAGQARIEAVARALRLPGPDPALLAAAPLRLTAEARLDAPDRPVAFTLSHPLLDAQGTAITAGTPGVKARLSLPDLAPFAALGGVAARGRLDLTLDGGPAAARLDADLALSEAPAPLPALLGPRAHLSVAASRAGDEVTLRDLTLTGAALRAGLSGRASPRALDLDLDLSLPDLARAVPTLLGAARLEAHLQGPPDRIALRAKLEGEVGAAGVPAAPVRLAADIQGLPAAPQGRLTGEGSPLGQPLNLALAAARAGDGAIRLEIERADWSGLHLEGGFERPAGAALPTGRLALRAPRLAALGPLLGQPLAGAASLDLALGQDEATMAATIRGAGIPGSRVGEAVLRGRLANLAGTPDLDAVLTVAGFESGSLGGRTRLSARGTASRLDLALDGEVSVAGTPSTIAAGATADVEARTLVLRSAEAVARVGGGQRVRLLAPATFRLGTPVSVDLLRLGSGGATLDVAGRLSPTLDATLRLRAPADLGKPFLPAADLDGTVTVEARLTGPPAQPQGNVHLVAAGLHARGGEARGLPPARVEARIDLQGASARVAAQAAAGQATLAVNGTAPLGAGQIDLRANGGLDLALLDPILTPGGRRARGQIALDASLRGTSSSPRLGGGVRLVAAQVQDFGQGVLIRDINGLARLEGQSAWLEGLAGKAGRGTIAIAGSAGVLAAGQPVDLRVTMRDARPLESDLINADLDSDLRLQGSVQAGLKLAGTVRIRRAELRVPATMPASVVTLDVRRPGAPPPPPVPAAAPLALDLTLDAPQGVFVRGRGIDAEMAGRLAIRGDSKAPQVSGGLDMRRGNITVAGTRLDFTRGKVGFTGTGVTGRIDPTLDFAAESTAGNVTATLAIGGTVSQPRITLSSSPELPQDEVLSYLLFRRSAKELGPFQLASIAASLAELTGVTSGLDPLDRLRGGLGLDRLSIGAGSGSGSAPSLEAGRYVAPGVYVGAKQGLSGADTQGTVQIDITRGLKLQTDVGSGTDGNSVGLTYQFEY